MATNKLLAVLALAAFLAACSGNDSREDEYADNANEAALEEGSLQGLDDGRGQDDLYADDQLAPGYEQSGGQAQVSAADLPSVLYFAFDRATLNSEARAAIDAQVAYLKDTVGTIRLEGHADERGTREYNLALAERRANAVADYMVVQGLPRYRIETVSYGEEQPVAFGQDERSWAENRRVEIK